MTVLVRPESVARYLRSCWPYRALNLGIWLTLAAVLMPLYQHRSLQPVFLGQSAPLAIALGVVTVVGLALLVAIVTQGGSFNRRLLVAFLLSGGVLEVGARLWPGGGASSQDPERLPAPYVMFSGRRPPAREQQADEVRIVVVGASAVLHGSSAAATLPGQLERQLHDAGYTQARVSTVATRSYVSGQELTALLHTVVDEQPDVVLVYDGGNDLHQPYVADPRPGYPYNFLVYEAGLAQAERRTSFAQAWAALWYRSRFLQRLLRHHLTQTVYGLGRLRRDAGYQSAAWEEAVVSSYLAHLDKMCHLATAYDFRLVVFLQPMLYTKSQPVGSEQAIALGGEAFQQYMQRQYRRAREGLQRLGKRYAAAGRCSCADLSLLLNTYGQPAFEDVIHLNDEGNRWLAQQMVAYLKQQKLVGRAAAWRTRQARLRLTNAVE